MLQLEPGVLAGDMAEGRQNNPSRMKKCVSHIGQLHQGLFKTYSADSQRSVMQCMKG